MRMSKVTALVAPLTVALVMAAVPARAERGGGPCRQDLQALCPDVTPGPGSFRTCLQSLCPDITPGPGAFRDCLQQNAAKLSPACQEHLSRMEAKMGAWRQACGGDVQTFCSDVAPGRRAIGKCLHDHQNDLSQACADLLAQHHWHHHGHRHHCAAPTPASESTGN